jgi:tetratricopeptide (TPR) repeat protein
MNNPPGPKDLDRFEEYLRDDAQNLHLLADAFDTALRIGQWGRAQKHLTEAKALVGADPVWRLREAHWLMAKQQHEQAHDLLCSLAAEPQHPDSLRPVIAHDLALISLRRGDVTGGIAVLAPWLESLPATSPADSALQSMWLRLLHHAGRCESAMAWATGRWEVQQLPASAAGVASLIALDSGDFEDCLRWADFALQRIPAHMEALVARAAMGLAQRDARTARRLLRVAMHHNDQDGRVWSTLGFTELLERRMPAARDSFEQAVRYMPTHIGTWHGLGWTALLQQDFDAARKAFEAAMALDRNFGETHGALAVVFATQGDPALAFESVERALRLDRNSLSARYAQSFLNGEMSNADALERLAEGLLSDVSGPLGGSVLAVLSGSKPTKK